MEYKETDYKIGDIFSLENGTKLEVVKSVLNCKGCYFFNEETKSCNKPRNTAVCSLFRRKDKTAIIFKQIKNNNTEEKRSIQISLEEAREMSKILNMCNAIAGGLLLGFAIIGVLSLIFIGAIADKPSALDVYQGKTTLEITYRDGIPVDSVVVYK